MKNINQLVNNLQKQSIQKKEGHELQNKIPPIVKGLVDQVFKQLKIIFPAYDHSLPTEQMVNDCKREWVKAFYENSIDSVELIKNGLMNARKAETDFLPSCGRFVSWCKPLPESIGWPTVSEALKQCIEYRTKSALFKDHYTRPLIIELCKRVDWWLMNNVSNQPEKKKADAHFNEVYIAFLNSGYVEPQKNNHEQLPTQEVVNSGLSEHQREDKKKRAFSHINEVKKKLKQRKINQNKEVQ